MSATSLPPESPPVLSVAVSPCPNDIFIFAGLILGQVPTQGIRWRWTFADIETLNDWAVSGRHDLLKISYANVARCRENYVVLEAGGALGHGVGPLLLKNDKTGDANFDPAQEVLVPGERTTANLLLDYYAREKYPAGLRKRFLPFDQLYKALCNQPGAQGVVIHENRFTYQRDGLTQIADLGSVWEAATGYPIPLGALLLRRGVADPAVITNLVRQSLVWARDNESAALQLCREHAQEMHNDVLRNHIQLYVNHYSEELGAAGRAAVAYFLAEQQKSRAAEERK